MDYLPEWFHCVNALPFWLLAFREVSPPGWALGESIPEWLMRGEIPYWIEGENNFANVPEWIMKGTYPAWMEAKIMKSEPIEFLKQGLVRYAVLYGDMRVPPDFKIPQDISWPRRLWDMKLGKAVNMITNQFLDLDRWDELLSIGYAFESYEEKGDILNDYRNDMKGGGVKMKAGHRFFRKKATDASYNYN